MITVAYCTVKKQLLSRSPMLSRDKPALHRKCEKTWGFFFKHLVSFFVRQSRTDLDLFFKGKSSNGIAPTSCLFTCSSSCGWGHREQKYLCTGKAASPARAMPTLSPTDAAAIANSLCLSPVCGRN